MSTRLAMRLAHTSPGRLRLRSVQQDAADHDFLSALAKQIARHRAVHEVRTSTRTGSVLVLYDGPSEALLEMLHQLDAIELEPVAPHAPMLRFKRALEQSEQRLSERTRGWITPGTLAFAASAAGALVQLRGGHFLPSAFSMLETALKAMEHEAARELASSRRG